MASSTATVVIAGDGFFQKLRHCTFRGWMVQFVVNEDSACVSFSLWNGKQQGALAAFGSSTEDESSSRSVPPTVMPNLQHLEFRVPVRALYKDWNGSCHSLGLHCLPSLRSVRVFVDCEGASPDDVEKAEAELRHAAQLHPNSPILDLQKLNENEMIRHSTGQIGDKVHTRCSAHSGSYVNSTFFYFFILTIKFLPSSSPRVVMICVRRKRKVRSHLLAMRSLPRS